MKTTALRAFGAAALVAATLSACGGSSGSAGASTGDAQATGVEAAATSTATATPAATASPGARTYTAGELEAVVGRLKDDQGRALSVLSAADVAASLEQTKAAMAAMTVEPAACRELALAGVAPSTDGAAFAVGSSVDEASGASTAISLSSGLDEAFLAQVPDMAGHLSTCATMSITANGIQISANITVLDGISDVPNAVGYRTDSIISDGRQQSMITVQAVQQGVLLSTVASGGASEQEAADRAGAMLDAAAGLLK